MVSCRKPSRKRFIKDLCPLLYGDLLSVADIYAARQRTRVGAALTAAEVEDAGVLLDFGVDSLYAVSVAHEQLVAILGVLGIYAEEWFVLLMSCFSLSVALACRLSFARKASISASPIMVSNVLPIRDYPREK